MPSYKHKELPDTRTPVYIDIWPESSSLSSSLGSSSSSRSRVPSSSLSKSPSLNTPRHMRDLDPTVTFVSPSVVIGKSSYIIVLDGAPIHSEDTELECIGPYSNSSVIPPGGSPLLYSTALVPKYWDILCKSPGPYFLALTCCRCIISSQRPHYVHHHSGCVPPRSSSPRKVFRASALCSYLLC